MSVRVVKRVAIAAGVVALGVAAVLVVGAGVSFVVGERGGAPVAQAGVTVSGGVVVIEACSGRGIGKVVIQRGADDVDGPVVWSATSAKGSADTVRFHVPWRVTRSRQTPALLIRGGRTRFVLSPTPLIAR